MTEAGFTKTNAAWSDGELLDRKGFVQKAIARGVPEHCADGLAGYITGDYKHVGDFLRALLCNDLRETFARADDINQHAIRNYMMFLCNDAPSGCYGSPEKFSEWLNREPETITTRADRKKAEEGA